MILQTTLSLAAAAAIINLWLAIRTGKLRYASKSCMATAASPLLMQRMRAQANFVENTPFVLILIAAIEMTRQRRHLACGGRLHLHAGTSEPCFRHGQQETNPFRALASW